LVTGSFLAVLGFVMHRMNVSVTGMERASGVSYFPSWMEFAVSLSLVAGGFAIFGLAVRYLPIFPEVVPQTVEGTAPAWLVVPSTPAFAPGGSPTAAPPGARGGTH
jgi:Ni/Fe-hydrogenase subunit HybB-like protein